MAQPPPGPAEFARASEILNYLREGFSAVISDHNLITLNLLPQMNYENVGWLFDVSPKHWHCMMINNMSWRDLIPFCFAWRENL